MMHGVVLLLGLLVALAASIGMTMGADRPLARLDAALACDGR